MTKKYISVVFQYEDGANLPSNLVTAFSSFSKEYEDCIVYDTCEGNVIDEHSRMLEVFDNMPIDLEELLGEYDE
jgi:hypothetical protein